MLLIVYREKDGEIAAVERVNEAHAPEHAARTLGELYPHWERLGLRAIVLPDEVHPTTHRVERSPTGLGVVERPRRNEDGLDVARPDRPWFLDLREFLREEREGERQGAERAAATTAGILWGEPTHMATRGFRRCISDCLLRGREYVRPPISKKVSVIIPCFNMGKFLGTAIHSVLSAECRVLSQRPGTEDSGLSTQDSGLEVIVVAQGCTDESVAVAQRFREADQRVRIVEVPLNLGAAFARNWGILHARGEWYAFLDADDAYEAGAIEALLQAGERAKGSEFGVQGSGREEGERRKAEGENKDCGLLSAECGLNGTDSKSEIRNPQLAMPVVVHGRSRAWDPEMKRALYEEPWRAEVTAGRLKEQCCFVPGCMLAHEATFWQKELWWAECWQRIEDYEWQAAALGRVQFVFLDKVVLRKRETTESRAKWPAQSAWSRELRRLIQARLRR